MTPASRLLSLLPLALITSVALGHAPTDTKKPDLSVSVIDIEPPAQPLTMMPDPSGTQFTKAERGADAVARAKLLLAEVAQSYRTARTLHDSLTISYLLNDQTTSGSFQMDSDMNGNFRSRGTDGGQLTTVTVLKDMLYVEADHLLSGSFVGLPLLANANGLPDICKTLQSATDWQAAPLPHYSLRYGDDDSSWPASLCFGSLESARVAGLRKNGRGDDEMLIVGDNGTAVVVVDANSRFLRTAVSHFTPTGALPGVTVKLTIEYSPVVAEALAVPITFEKNGRTRVTSLKEGMETTPSARNDADGLIQFGSSPPPLQGFDWIGNPLAERPFGDGNVYVVALFAEWAPPARKAMTELSKVAESTSDLPIRIVHLGVLERKPGSNRSFVESRPMSRVASVFVGVEHSSAQNPRKTPWLERFGSDMIPFAVVIDRGGRAVWTGHTDELCDKEGIEFLRRVASQSPAPPSLRSRLDGLAKELIDADTRDAAIAVAKDMAATELAGSVGGLSMLAEILFHSNLSGDADERMRTARSICDAAWTLCKQGDPYTGYLRAKVALRLGATDAEALKRDFTGVFPVNSVHGPGAKMVEVASAEILPRHHTPLTLSSGNGERGERLVCVICSECGRCIAACTTYQEAVRIRDRHIRLTGHSVGIRQ